MDLRRLFGGGRRSSRDIIVNRMPRQPALAGLLPAMPGLPKRTPVKRPLRIALLTAKPTNYSSKAPGEAAEARLAT